MDTNECTIYTYTQTSRRRNHCTKTAQYVGQDATQSALITYERAFYQLPERHTYYSECAIGMAVLNYSRNLFFVNETYLHASQT